MKKRGARESSVAENVTDENVEGLVGRVELVMGCAPLFRSDARCRVRQFDSGIGCKPARERGPQHRAKRLDGRSVTIGDRAGATRLERIHHCGHREGRTLDDKRGQAPGHAADSLDRNRFGHAFPW